MVWDRFERQRMESGAAGAVAEQAQAVKSALATIGNDIIFVSRMPALQRLIERRDDPETRSEIESIFEETALENPNISQITFLDRSGFERARVEQARDDMWITPERMLQDRSAAAYFAGTRLVPQSVVYVLPLELDREQGRIIEPRRLVLRITTPVTDRSGAFAGALVITALGSNVMAPFASDAGQKDRSTVLIDSQGNWLAGVAADRLWGSRSSETANDTFATTHPAVWSEIQNGATGRVWDANVLYTFTTLNPSRDARTYRRATSFTPVQTDQAELTWKIVNMTTIRKAEIVAKPENIALIVIALLAAIGASWAASGVQNAKRTAERRVRMLDRRMRDILDNIQASVQVRDLDGRFIMVNKAMHRHTGVREEELIGAKLRDIFNEDIARVAEEIDQAAWNGTSALEPSEVTYPSGHTYLINAFLLYDEHGKQEAVCTTAVDISQLKSIEQELVVARRHADDANHAKSRFLASMSHEFRTPMNAIIGYSEMLIEDATADGQKAYADDLNRILAASRHLLSLINEVLDLSKIEAGRMELFIEEIDARSLIDQVVATTQPLVEKNGNELVVKLRGLEQPLRNDATRLRQIILNLVSNAAKFTHNGTITLEGFIERSDGRDWIEISVADTGIGMTDEQVAQLFQEFSQAKTESAKAGEGTGLGLNISRALAHMMAGDIAVQSKHGAGSRFILRVPVDVDNTAYVAPISDKIVAAVPQYNAPILVVDHDRSTQELISRFLTREGFKVVTASSGPEAIARARQIKPMAITLDVFLEGLDGWQVIQEIGNDPELRQIPVIMCTVADQRGRSLSLGAVDCLVKPVDRDTLMRTISNAVAAKDGPYSVLVIDDEIVNRRQFTRHLSESGHTVIEAQNGLEALRILEKNVEIDIIILDLIMPVMDGFRFLRELRNNLAWETIPVVVVTAKSLSSAEIRDLKYRAQSIVERTGRDLDEVLGSVKEEILIHALRAPLRTALLETAGL